MKFLILFFLFLAMPAQAEILILKNGKKIEGKVIERRADAIKLNVGGLPTLYFLDEIKEIVAESGNLPYHEIADKPPRPLADIPPAKAELIRKLMEYNGAKLSIEKVFNELIRKAPPDKVTQYQLLFRVDEMLNLVIPVYDKYYTEPELQEMIAFYSSSTGQKLIEITPITIQESLKVVVQYFEEKTKESK